MDRKLPDWMIKKTCSKNDNGNDDDEISNNNQLTKSFITFEGKVRYLNKFGACGYVCEAILEKLKTLDQLVLGFDLEWPVHFNKNTGAFSHQDRTALIQVCPTTNVCYLFHVWQWRKLPQVFVDLLRHPKVRLVGVNIRGDIWKLGRDFDISVVDIVEKNTIELRTLANDVLLTRTRWSLEKLVRHLLNKGLDKSLDVRTSNWAKEVLSPHQVQYAATDAYVSLLVYQRLKELESEKYVASAECVESGSSELWGSSVSAESSIGSY